MDRVAEAPDISAEGSQARNCKGVGVSETTPAETWECPRCHGPAEGDYYGPCARCVEQLRGGAARPKVTRRVRRRYRHRPTEHLATSPSAAALLGELGAQVERVLLVGPVAGGGTIAGARRWATAVELPDGWQHGEHYLTGHAPVFRFNRGEGGPSVEILPASMWWGDGDYTPADSAAGWEHLSKLCADGFDEGRLLSTPATTGRYLFVRSLGRREFPVLSDEVQELIRATSGQGRIELFDGPAELASLVEYDGRVMYAGLCNELGHGTPVRDTSDEYAGPTRGRYRVTFTVPPGWDHVGILGVADAGGGWSWPAEPGARGTAWVDGVELGIALRHGWSVEIHERLLFPEQRGRPLDRWASTLAGWLPAGSGPRAQMLRAAVRAMLLHTIGAFHGRGHRLTGVATDSAQVPEHATGVDWDPSAGVYTFTLDGGQRWAELSHPEWSAAIWGRARARLLDAPTGAGQVRAGMLHTNRSSLVGVRTDAIYMDSDPSWPDDGKVGRFRLKRSIPGPHPRPDSHRQLLALRKG